MARRNARSQDDAPKAKLDRQGLHALKELYKYVLPYRLKFFWGLVFLLLSSITTLAFPYITKELVDNAVEGEQGGMFGSVNEAALVLVGVLVLQAVFSYFRILWFVEVGEKSLADLRRDLYKHLIRLEMPFFAQRRVGELTSRLSSDISMIQDTFTTTLAELIRGVLNLLIGVVVIVVISWKLTGVMLAVFPAIVFAAIFFGRYLRRLSREQQDRLAEANVVIEESLQGVQSVKAYGNEPYEINRYSRAIGETVKVAMKTARMRGAFASFIILALFGSIVWVIWFGFQLYEAGDVSIGDLIAFVLYTGFVGAALGGFSEYYAQIQRSVGATERIREILQTTPEHLPQFERKHPDYPNRMAGELELRNLHFAYPDQPDNPILGGVDLLARPGEHIALVGPSGSGKSTIMKLLLRFYEPSHGEVRYDGQPAPTYPLDYLRSQLALVPQDVLLFGGTIYENILYGDLQATPDQVEQAARRANAHDFISQFPDGYQTVVGERGVKLSGGQRQRVAIARAILKDPAFLLLDEATSSLDSESEHLVQQALEELMRGRTTVVIAHRLSTIRTADQILVLHNGQVVQRGRHEDLFADTAGVYYSLAKFQYMD